jgi:tetratricopeptide (TPR) repeat protein
VIQAYRLAKRKYSEAIEICPSYGDAFAERGYLRALLWSAITGRRLGAGPFARADVRRALRCRFSDWPFHARVADMLPLAERLPALREGLARTKDEVWRFCLGMDVAARMFAFGAYRACVAELEGLPALTPDAVGLRWECARRDLRAQAYSAMGEHEEAARAYSDALFMLLEQYEGLPDPVIPPDGDESDSEDGEARSMCGTVERQVVPWIEGLARSRARCNDLPAAMAALQEWRALVPEVRLSLYRSAFEILSGVDTHVSDSFQSWWEAQGEEDGYLRFLSGIVLAHVGASGKAARLLRTFLRESRARARAHDATHEWERAQAQRILRELGWQVRKIPL